MSPTFEGFSRFLKEITAPAEGLIEVYSDRVRLTVRRKIVQAAIGAGVAGFMAVWLGVAALAVFRGARGGFTALCGREWLGDLTAGLLAVGLAGAAGALYLRLSARRDLARLKAKYEQIRDEHEETHPSPSPTDNG
jgi:hypothetical protein